MTYYLKKTPNPSGAYPPPQDFPGENTIPITDAQRDMVIENGGFVKVEENRQPDGSVGYTITPDPDAWDAWKAVHPEELSTASDTDVLNTLLGVI